MNETTDKWVTTTQVANVMLDLCQKEEWVGGTVVEVGTESNRLVERLMDPGSGESHRVSNIGGAFTNVGALIEKDFGK